MWRFLLVVVALGVLGSACSGEQSIEEDFVQMMGKLKEATFTVTYDYEGPDGPGEPVTWYRTGESQRLDIQVAPSRVVDEGYKRVVLQDSEGSYICSEVATNMTYGLAGCVLEPTNSAIFFSGPPSWLQIAIGRPDDLDVEPLESRKIAGVETRCFSVEADSGEGADLDVCLTADGVPLYLKVPVPNIDIDGQFVHTATAFSKDVPKGIFEPPMEVVGAGPLCSGPTPLGNCGPQDSR